MAEASITPVRPATLAEVNYPLASVIMGSDSDLVVAIEAVRVLNEFEIPNETRVVSAHRTPEHMLEYARSARLRGIITIITAAGGSAHLPGMTSTETTLAVKGIAVNKDASDPHGAALFSMVEMPPDGGALDTSGINVAGAVGAALSAVRTLANVFPELHESLEARKKKLELDVLYKDFMMLTVGAEKYAKEVDLAKASGDKWPVRPDDWDPSSYDPYGVHYLTGTE